MALPIETVSKPVSEMTNAEMEIILFEAQKNYKRLKECRECNRRRNTKEKK